MHPANQRLLRQHASRPVVCHAEMHVRGSHDVLQTFILIILISSQARLLRGASGALVATTAQFGCHGHLATAGSQASHRRSKVNGRLDSLPLSVLFWLWVGARPTELS